MAPRRRAKGQLTLLDFAKNANPRNTPNSSTRSHPPNQSTQENTLKLPRASVPSIFKNTLPTPKRHSRDSHFSSAADEAWEIGERVLNGVNLNSRVSYEEDGKEMPDDSSDADFEQEEVIHHVARQRPSLKRKHAAYGLRDDRASMTKRSANKKPKRRTPIKIATQCSMGLPDEGDLEDGPGLAIRREVIDQHEVFIVEGEKSEMSGTDNEEADVSRPVPFVNSSEKRRRISLAGSVITPSNQFKIDGRGQESPFQTPEEFSLGQGRASFVFTGGKAPRKARLRHKEEKAHSPKKNFTLSPANIPDKRSTGEPRREKGSVIETIHAISPNRTPSSTRRLVRRLHVSDSEPSEPGDLPGVREKETGCEFKRQDLSINEHNDEILTTKASERASQGRKSKERVEWKLVSSADEGESLAALVERSKGSGCNSLVVREGPVVGAIQNSANGPRQDQKECGHKITEALRTRSSGPRYHEGMRGQVFDSDVIAPTPSTTEAATGDSTGPNPNEKVCAAVSDRQVGMGEDVPAKHSLVAGNSGSAKFNRESSLPHETPLSFPRPDDTEPISKRKYDVLGDGGDQLKGVNRGSESRRRRLGIISIESSSEGEGVDDLDEKSGDSQEENFEKEQIWSSRIVTRSISRRAERSVTATEPSPVLNLGNISDNSSDSSDDGSVQEVLPQGSAENHRATRHETQTPERYKRVRSSFLHSGRKRISITPESSPSPPSSRKRFRLRKLATKDSDEEENAHLVTQLLDTPGTDRTPNPEHNGRKQRTKDGEWYHERDITNFSSSSSLDRRHIPASETRRSSQVLARRRRVGLRVRNSPPIRKLDLESDSPDPQEVNAMNSEVSIEQNPGVLSLEDDAGDRWRADHGIAGKDVENAVINLVDDIEGDPADSASGDCADRGDEIRNPVSSGNSGKGEDVDFITVDDEDKPPPFNLIILCNPGERVKEMVERLGEEEIMERVTEAQNEGREVLGGEELGLTQSFNQGVFGRFSRTVVADQIGQKRKIKNVTEQALRGEYEFNYRGKNAEKRGRRGGGSWQRGRARQKRVDSSTGIAGRLANVRRRRSRQEELGHNAL